MIEVKHTPKNIDTKKHYYFLLDWGGNIEDKQYMTAYEAKQRNDKIISDWGRPCGRLIRWAPADGEIKNVYLW